MSIIPHARLRLAMLLATGLVAFVASGESHAYTADQQQACMVRNRAQLSPECRAFVRPGPEAREEASDGRPRPAKVRLHRIRKPRPDDT